MFCFIERAQTPHWPRSGFQPLVQPSSPQGQRDDDPESESRIILLPRSGYLFYNRLESAFIDAMMPGFGDVLTALFKYPSLKNQTIGEMAVTGHIA